MAISTLSSNILQGIVTPFAVFQGHKAYNPTSLSEINTIEGLDVSGDFMAGQHSNTHLQSCVYQSKYNSDVVWVFDNLFGTPNNFDAQLTNQNRTNYFSLARFKNKKLVDIIQTYGVETAHYCMEFVDEDLNNIYVYEHNTARILVYNKIDFKLAKEINLSIDAYSSDKVFFFKRDEDTIYYYNTTSNSSPATTIGNLKYFSKSNGTNAVKLNVETDTSCYGRCNIIPIIHNNELFASGCATSSKSMIYLLRHNLLTNNHEYYHLDSSIGAYFSKLSYSEKGDYYTSKFIVTEDSDGNKYLSYVSGYSIAHTSTYYNFYTVQIHSEIQHQSITTINTAYQTIGQNCNHFIQIDDETILLGNGSSIIKYKWSKELAKWEKLCEFNVGEYSFFSYENGKIWIRKRDSIVRVLESQGVVLDITFEKDVYQWTGSNITTYANVRLLNQDSQQTDTVQTIKITGPATFSEGQLTQTITFDADDTVAVPVIITGVGPIEITLEF